MSVRHVGDSAELMTDAVAGAPIDAAQAGRRQPNRELAVEASGKIGRVGMIGRQRFGQ